VGSADGDAFVQARGNWKRIAWTICFIGFLLYVFVITTYRLQIGDVGVGIGLVGLLFQKGRFRFPKPLVLFSILLVWCALGYFQTRWPSPVKLELTNLAKLGLILVVMVNALRTRSQIRAFVIFWLGCFALFPLRGAYITFFVGGYTVAGRAVWNYIYRNPNDLAALTLLMLGLCAGVLVSDSNKWFRRAALVGMVMLSLLVFMTQSRGAFIGFAIFAGFALVSYKQRAKALVIAALASIVIALAAPSSVWQRLESMTNATGTEDLKAMNDDGSAEQRFEIWRTAARITMDNPIVGVGWGAYPMANDLYSPATAGSEFQLGKRDAHSTYLRTAAELGIPGLVLFLGLISTVLLYSRRVRLRCRAVMPTAAQQLRFMELGLIAFMVTGVFGSFSRLSFLYLIVMLIWVTARVCEDDLRAYQKLLPR
jgi:probable O-glycosylation ligase (exosortase A-associated)